MWLYSEGWYISLAYDNDAIYEGFTSGSGIGEHALVFWDWENPSTSMSFIPCIPMHLSLSLSVSQTPSAFLPHTYICVCVYVYIQTNPLKYKMIKQRLGSIQMFK